MLRARDARASGAIRGRGRAGAPRRRPRALTSSLVDAHRQPGPAAPTAPRPGIDGGVPRRRRSSAEGIRAIRRPNSRRAAGAISPGQAPAIVLRAPEPPVPAPPGLDLLLGPGLVVPQPGALGLPASAAGSRSVAPSCSSTASGCGSRCPAAAPQPLRRIGRKAAAASAAARPARSRANPGFHVMTPLPFPSYGSPTARRIGAWIVRAAGRAGGAAHRRHPGPAGPTPSSS